MPVTAVFLTSIVGNREIEPLEQLPEVKASHAIDFTGVGVSRAELPAGKLEGAALRFKYRVEYQPNVGEIEIEGVVIYKTDGIDEIIKSWKEERRVPERIALECIEAITMRCTPELVYISKEVRLPPPIPYPKVSKRRKEQQRNGGGG
ncbi:hypothetical protein DRN46_03925 [Thermococci archaeon]|nr:MAG: hypothetical protein DRN46_03925 [Thermococci archaeon]RLF91481.1 MAG: hypothetical protein DRN52_08965 [Thermococci archaeon]